MGHGRDSRESMDSDFCNHDRALQGLFLFGRVRISVRPINAWKLKSCIGLVPIPVYMPFIQPKSPKSQYQPNINSKWHSSTATFSQTPWLYCKIWTRWPNVRSIVINENYWNDATLHTLQISSVMEGETDGERTTACELKRLDRRYPRRRRGTRFNEACRVSEVPRDKGFFFRLTKAVQTLRRC